MELVHNQKYQKKKRIYITIAYFLVHTEPKWKR